MTNALTNKIGALQAPQLDYILLDGSSSMMGKWWPTLGMLDTFIEVLKAENINSHAILSVFDTHDLDCVLRNSTIGEWKLFRDDPIGAHWGGTPLYDAINVMGRNLRDLDPPRASIVIATDGEDTGNRFTDVVQARAILDWCRAKGWQVTFVGCDFNNSRQSRALGANETNSIGVRKELLSEGGKLLGQKRTRNARTGDDINFSDDERKNFGGYLTHG